MKKDRDSGIKGVVLPSIVEGVSRFRAKSIVFLAGVLLLAAAELQAQSISVGTATGTAGAAIDVDLGFGAGSTGVTAISIDLSFGSPLTFISAAAGSAAGAAGKSILSNTIAGGARILVYGLNQTPIGTGTLATVRLGTAGAAPGVYALSIAAVTASDANGKSVPCSTGNGSISLSTPPNNVPPVISGVASSSITSSSAVIQWTTDTPSDSQVEYGPSTSYGSLSLRASTLVTTHSVTMTNLSAGAFYHSRVRSIDAGGNFGVSNDFTLTTTMALTLFYPHLASMSTSLPARDNQLYIGAALANLDQKPATLKFTLFDASGSKLGGNNITNPSTRTIDPGKQLPIIENDLFGSGLSSHNSPGWTRIESTSSNVAGFFLMFNGSLTSLDGAAASSSPLTSFVLPEIEDQSGFTTISIANPNPDPASLEMDIVQTDGTVLASVPWTINGGAAMIADLAGDLLSQVAYVPSAYIRVTSSRGVVPFELLGKPDRDFAVLSGQDSMAGAGTLYCPQYVVGGGYQSVLSIINLDSSAGGVTMRFIDDRANLLGEKSVTIPASGKIRIDDQSFFTPVSPDSPLTQGYLQIVGSGIHLTGSISFSGPGAAPFAAALPLVSVPKNTVLFSQVASDGTYFTGISILNPNGTDALALLDVYSSDGQLQFRSLVPIRAGQRISKLLTEYFPELLDLNRSSGYVRVTSDKPLASFAVFGTHDLRVLASIPPQ